MRDTNLFLRGLPRFRIGDFTGSEEEEIGEIEAMRIFVDSTGLQSISKEKMQNGRQSKKNAEKYQKSKICIKKKKVGKKKFKRRKEIIFNFLSLFFCIFLFFFGRLVVLICISFGDEHTKHTKYS